MGRDHAHPGDHGANLESPRSGQPRIPLEDQHRILWDHAYDAIVVTDADGRLLQANRRYAEMLGHAPEEMNNLFLEDIIHPDDLKMVQERHSNRIRGAEPPRTYTARCVRSDGTILHLQTTSSLITDGQGHGVTLDIIRDITPQVLAEAEIQERNAQLMTSNRRYQDLLDFMTHELKNPLTMLRAYSELLVEGSGGKLTQKSHRIAMNLWRGANRMEHLISTYLHLSRIESGNVAVNREIVHFVKEILEPAKDFLTVQLDANEMTVEVDPKGLAEVEIDVDRELMQAAVQNLLSNAIKYGFRGSPIVVHVTEDDEFVTVAFRNQGAGIPMEKLEDVFKKYHRGTRKGDNPLRSSGIGLYLVKRIMEEHGGQATMSSVEGQWAEATLALPRKLTLSR